MPVSTQKSLSTAQSLIVSAAFLMALTSPCHAQRNSGASAITLTAVLSQSLSMSVMPAQPGSVSVSDFFSYRVSCRAASQPSALTISTKWVRGPGRVSVEVFAPGNPLLGAVGQALVPVEIPAPSVAGIFSPGGYGFLSPSNRSESTGLPESRIDTSALQIPAGSEAGMLTIRAQVL